jgi:uncharacterized protein (TIGR00375 family)
MRFVADFHIHSKFSRATSKDMEVETIALWGEKKGISLMGTGDFTHPSYFSELKEKLKPLGNGLFELKKGKESVKFILTTEVSNIYQQNNALRRIHTIIFAPSFEVVEKINTKLARYGKLSSDGRPIFGFSAKDLLKIILETSPDCFLVPAHAWTPWFSIFGANSGFDSISECYGELSKYIFSIETGLSSDPKMNWRVSALDKISLISNSDAHSPQKIGREANVFDGEMSYSEIIDALKKKDKKRFLFTLEFFPEEGKYHFDGHRNCGILFSPEESIKNQNICPVCHKKLTLGVMNRVEKLADRKDGFVPENSIPYKSLIPLDEIIAESLGLGVGTKGVEDVYEKLISSLGPELFILMDASLDEITRVSSPKVSEGIKRVREGKVSITPGFDGEYGKVKIFEEGEKVESEKQIELF